jgi:hypothetical protein
VSDGATGPFVRVEPTRSEATLGLGRLPLDLDLVLLEIVRCAAEREALSDAA